MKTFLFRGPGYWLAAAHRGLAVLYQIEGMLVIRGACDCPMRLAHFADLPQAKAHIKPMANMSTTLWQILVAARNYLSSPRVEIVQVGTMFGRLQDRQFALLLKLEFRNESNQAVLIRSLRVRCLGAWHDHEKHTPTHSELHLTHGWPIGRFPPRDAVEENPRIPQVDAVERFAFFHLPEPGEECPQNLEVTVKVKFSRGKRRKLAAIIRAPNQGDTCGPVRRS